MQGRNVHVYEGCQAREIAGKLGYYHLIQLASLASPRSLGFWQHGRITISTFYDWLHSIVRVADSWLCLPLSLDQHR
jgi:hypothetical protein